MRRVRGRQSASLLHSRLWPALFSGSVRNSRCEEPPAISGSRTSGYAPKVSGRGASPPRTASHVRAELVRFVVVLTGRSQRNHAKPSLSEPVEGPSRQAHPAPASPSALLKPAPLILSLSKDAIPHSPAGDQPRPESCAQSEPPSARGDDKATAFDSIMLRAGTCLAQSSPERGGGSPKPRRRRGTDGGVSCSSLNTALAG